MSKRPSFSTASAAEPVTPICAAARHTSAGSPVGSAAATRRRRRDSAGRWRVVCGSSPRYGRTSERRPEARIRRRASPASTRAAARATRVGSRASPPRPARARSRRCDQEGPSEASASEASLVQPGDLECRQPANHIGDRSTSERERDRFGFAADARRRRSPARIPGRATACRRQRTAVVVASASCDNKLKDREAHEQAIGRRAGRQART